VYCCIVSRTPLHCAASCNNAAIVQLLVQHGACVFATTLSDQEKPSEKCEADEDNYETCLRYLHGEILLLLPAVQCIHTPFYRLYKYTYLVTWWPHPIDFPSSLFQDCAYSWDRLKLCISYLASLLALLPVPFIYKLKGSVKEPNKFHIYETEKITRKASDPAEYIELFGSFTRDRHARRI